MPGRKAGLIWYRTLHGKLQAGSSLQDAASLSFEVAGEVRGAGSEEQEAVRSGWAGVGINVEGQSQGQGCLQAVVAYFRSIIQRGAPRR